jgi:HAD superfamily phosphoserine phosphatase-like hydrolase
VIDELDQYRTDGARIIVASGTYQPVAEAFASRIGAEAIGTPIAFDEDGRATGELGGALTTGEAKVNLVSAALRGDTLIAAYGDTEGDIPMLSLAQRPVATYPDAALRAKAVASGWRVIG